SNQIVSSPYAIASSRIVGVKMRNHAKGQSTNQAASQLPAASACAPNSSIGRAARSEKKLNAAATSPLIVAPDAMIGTTTAFATRPTTANWLKWKAVSGAVPTIAQNDTAR